MYEGKILGKLTDETGKPLAAFGVAYNGNPEVALVRLVEEINRHLAEIRKLEAV